MPQSAVHRMFNGLGIALGLLPLAILFVFCTYLVRTRLVAGHWPSYGHPESWSQGFTLHYALLRPWFLVLPVYLLPVVAAIYDALLWAFSRRFPKLAFAIVGISACVIWGWWYTDPGKFLDWFLD
jgi:hypothetical protein